MRVNWQTAFALAGFVAGCVELMAGMAGLRAPTLIAAAGVVLALIGWHIEERQAAGGAR